MALVEVRDLRVAFGRDRREVVREISFAFDSGDRVGLIGESGSGKSVTALALMGLLPETAHVSGSIRFDGVEMLGRSDREWSRLRGNRMTMVFQEPMTALDPTMKVGRQVAEVLELHGQSRPGGGGTRDRVVAMLDAVGLPSPDRIAGTFPHELSGGQRQRVVLAMALINQPDLVICDEPTTALDVTVQAKVLDLLDRSLDEVGAACLFISHDLAVVSQVCHEVLVMLDGEIVERGPDAEVFREPRHAYTRGLLATARLDLLSPGARLPVVADFWRRDAEDGGRHG
ncbi:ABC transporter ATP-binding protein [Mariniluteicoccus flavus]